MLTCHLCQGFPTGLLPSVFPTKVFNTFLIFPIISANPTGFSLCNFTIEKESLKKQKLVYLVLWLCRPVEQISRDMYACTNGEFVPGC